MRKSQMMQKAATPSHELTEEQSARAQQILAKIPAMAKPELSGDDEQLLSDYMAYIEKTEREKEEEMIRKSEASSVSKSQDLSSSSSDDEENALAAFMDPTKSADRMLRRLNDPKRMALILDSLQNNEELKNIFLQRSSEDINSLQGCNLALKGFFGERQFPDFYRSKLGNSKFTPIVDLTKDLNEATERGWHKTETISDTASPKHASDKAGMDTDSLKDQIVVNDVYSKLIRRGTMLSMLINKNSREYEEMLKDLKERPLNPEERLALLKLHILAAAKMLKYRQRELEQIKSEYFASETVPGAAAPKSADSLAPTRLTSGTMSTAGTADGKRKRKYRVNMGMLGQRAGMGNLELMERRYKLITGKK